MNTLFTQSLRMFLFLSLLTGVIYPLFITLIVQPTMHHQANGSLLRREGKVIGSTLIGQKFTQEKYFWGRPSAVDYNPLPSGGTNLGPSSAQLRKLVIERGAPYSRSKSPVTTPIPSELIFASGSGLDPHISPTAAQYQIDRVAKARDMDTKEGREKLESLIQAHTTSRFLGILGHPFVNVLTLNLALDEGSEHHD